MCVESFDGCTGHLVQTEEVVKVRQPECYNPGTKLDQLLDFLEGWMHVNSRTSRRVNVHQSAMSCFWALQVTGFTAAGA